MKVAHLHAFLLGVGKHSTFTIMKELHFTPSGTLVLSDADAPTRELITRVWEFSTPFKLVRPPN
jgi:hypothetical protein